jgi:hypothetical protein
MAAGDLLPTGEAIRPCEACGSEDVVTVGNPVSSWQQDNVRQLVVGVRCRDCGWEYRSG